MILFIGFRMNCRSVSCLDTMGTNEVINKKKAIKENVRDCNSYTVPIEFIT